MKTLLSFFVLIFLGSSMSFSAEPDEYSTIYFYRIKSYAEGKKPFELFINDIKIGEIKSNERIKFKVYSEGEAVIYAKSTTCETVKINLVIKDQHEYYIKVDGITCFLKEFDLDKGKFDFNNPNNFSKGIAQLQEDKKNPLPLIPIRQKTLAQNVENQTRDISIKDEVKVTIAKSDVDVYIPVSKRKNENTFAVIIANENYQKEVPVQFAANDGKVFKEYCEKTLGIPSNNVHFVQDATFGNMKSEIKWISDVAEAYDGKAKIIFYYAGHGMPDEKDKSAYLLPVDGFSSDFETAISLEELYNRLGQHPTQSVTVFIDACFSGSVRDDGMLASARAVKIKPKETALKGKMVVFSAATGEETAYPFIEKQHGLFTYFLLKKLQETKGDVDFKSLSDYLLDNVKRQAIVVNQKSQTPQVNVSTSIQDSWKEMKIK